jgi:peroxiredoxin-like protein
MDNTHFYEVKLNWESDRKGLISSPVLQSTIQVATPPEFPKGISGIWSPEHLLVAAVNSCLMTTFLAIAENSKFEFISFHSNATGKLEKIGGKYMISEIVLLPVLIIKNDSDKEKALRALNKSETSCLISNSIKSNIVFQPTINVQETEFIDPIDKRSFIT